MITGNQNTDNRVASLAAQVEAILKLSKKNKQPDKQPADEGTSVVEKTPILPTPDSSLMAYGDNVILRENGEKA